MGSKLVRKVRVAFVCTHNACRSQMAEAIARELAGASLEPCSAGTHPAKRVNADAIRVLQRRHGIDATGLRPKALTEIEQVDVVVTMGCGVRCPALPCAYREDWGLEDPTGKGDEAFEACARAIEERIRDLVRRIDRAEIPGVSAPLGAEVMRALADENRLAIIGALADDGELCACKILERLEIGQSTLSHHMKILVDCGLVSARKDGRWMHYRLDRRRLAAVGAAIVALAGDKG